MRNATQFDFDLEMMSFASDEGRPREPRERERSAEPGRELVRESWFDVAGWSFDDVAYGYVLA